MNYNTVFGLIADMVGDDDLTPILLSLTPHSPPMLCPEERVGSVITAPAIIRVGALWIEAARRFKRGVMPEMINDLALEMAEGIAPMPKKIIDSRELHSRQHPSAKIKQVRTKQ